MRFRFRLLELHLAIFFMMVAIGFFCIYRRFPSVPLMFFAYGLVGGSLGAPLGRFVCESKKGMTMGFACGVVMAWVFAVSRQLTWD